MLRYSTGTYSRRISVWPLTSRSQILTFHISRPTEREQRNAIGHTSFQIPIACRAASTSHNDAGTPTVELPSFASVSRGKHKLRALLCLLLLLHKNTSTSPRAHARRAASVTDIRDATEIQRVVLRPHRHSRDAQSSLAFTVNNPLKHSHSPRSNRVASLALLPLRYVLRYVLRVLMHYAAVVASNDAIAFMYR